MKILYEKLLLEDIEAVKRQYSHIPDEEFDEIIKLDPTFKEGSNSVGKYGKWLLGLYKKDNPLEHEIEEIYGLLSLYDNYKNDRKKDIEKDINKFKSIADLYDVVNNVGEAELSARQKERELRNSKDVKKVFEDNKWEIWTPLSYAGSCTLGKGTEWCTAYSENDYYYYEYTEQGPLYVFINKQNSKEKYQLHVDTESFMNKNDDKANLEDVLATDNKLREFVYRDIYGYKIDKNGNFIYDGTNGIPESATSVIIEQGVTSIGVEEFDYCTSLQSVVIPDSVTSIGDKAFFHCTSLQSINIPDSVTEIGEHAFDSCISLKSVTIPDSVTEIGKRVFWCCTSLQSINIPDSVTSIGEAAFGFCKSLQSINIPDSVTSIGGAAFSTCESLQSIHIPHSVRVIDDSAFVACTSLQSINIPDSVTSIGNDAFDSCISLKSVTIPDSVTSIGVRAFEFCESLQSINIPDSVKHIGKNICARCTSLQSINIPDSVTSISDFAFEGCTSLKSINIPDSVTDIGFGAFNFCKSLKSITIPDSVTDIGDGAFYDCDNLKEVILENPDTEYHHNTFPEHTKIIKKGVNENMKRNKSKRKEIIVEFKNGKKVKYTTDILNLLLNDPEVLMIMDANTGEVMYDNEINKNKVVNENMKNKKINQLIRAKKLLESKGYKVRKKSLKEAYEVPYFKAYITNLGKYNEGELVGEWVDFPIDEDDFEDVLKSIDIDGKYYEEWFVTDYDCNLNGFDWEEFGEYPSLDDLNEFGELIDNIDSYNLDVINNAYEIIGDLKETINAVEDGKVYYYPGVYNDVELGYWMIDEIYDGNPTPDLAIRYFDYERYGRDIRLKGNGDFTEDGFVDYIG